MESTKAPILSVVVPVFNLEGTVHDALNSVLFEQELVLEVICVDDGSTDGSLQQILNFSQLDARVTVLSQRNQGLSGARNAGLNLARGKFVSFLDADDFLALGALAAGVKAMEAQGLDILFFEAADVSQDSSFQSPHQQDDRLFDLQTGPVMSGVDFFFSQLLSSKWAPSACLQMIRKSFLTENSLFFSPGFPHEDNLFTASALLLNPLVAHSDLEVYRRRLREGSITRGQKSVEHIEGLLNAHSSLGNFYCRLQPGRLQDRIKKLFSVREFQRIMVQSARKTFKDLPEGLTKEQLVWILSTSLGGNPAVRSFRLSISFGIGPLVVVLKKLSSRGLKGVLFILKPLLVSSGRSDLI